jgi:hypothetical protein
MPSNIMKRRPRRAAAGATTALCAVLALSAGGCGRIGGGAEPEVSAAATQAPIALTPRTDPASGGGAALAGKVNEAELRKAVERYRLIKHRADAPIDFVGVDLNGDGRSEAAVLFAGPDWCQKTGCSLVIFQEETVGYRVVSHMINVRPPILVGPESSFGWRDLIVKTGGGATSLRTVRLGFTGKGYPANALLQPEPVADMVSRSQQILAESQTFTEAMNQPAPGAPAPGAAAPSTSSAPAQ